MQKFTNLTIATSVLLLLPIRVIFSQMPASGQVCYLQREDGLTLDLANLCKPQPPQSKPPVLTDLERENQPRKSVYTIYRSMGAWRRELSVS